MLKELESMTYEEAVKEFSVLSLSFWRGEKKKNSYRVEWEDLTSSQQKTYQEGSTFV